MLEDNRLSFGARLIYCDIFTACFHEGIFTDTNRELSELLKVSKHTISDWIRELRDLSYINYYTEYVEGSNQIYKRVITIDDTYKPINCSVPSYLYMLQDDNNLIKIGISSDPKSRNRDFRHRGSRLIFSIYVDNAQQIEKDIHDMFSDYRIDTRTEWFDFKDTTIESIIEQVSRFISQNP